jgi:hypothetical protein
MLLAMVVKKGCYRSAATNRALWLTVLGTCSWVQQHLNVKLLLLCAGDMCVEICSLACCGRDVDISQFGFLSAGDGVEYKYDHHADTLLR